MLLAMLLLGLASPAAAKAAGDFAALSTAPTALAPDTAYLLLRTSRAKTGVMSVDHVLVRVPTDAEIAAWRSARQAAYDAALPDLRKKAKDGRVPPVEDFAFDYRGPKNRLITSPKNFIDDGELRTLLIAVPPGDYIVYGIGVAGRALVTCNCLGTVRFAARAGEITDLGSFYADKVHNDSPLPFLEDNVGPSMMAYGFIMGQAIDPATRDTAVPGTLAAFPRVTATYHAVGLFREPGATSINRLAPIPGVLAYDRGKVIDVRTGKPAE